MVQSVVELIVEAARRMFWNIFGLFAQLFDSPQRRQRRSAEAFDRYTNGKQVSLPASISGFHSVTSDWVRGSLEVSSGSVVWHSSVRSTSLGAVFRPDNFIAAGIRSVKDRESWSVDANCLVLMGELAGRRVDLAVQSDDVVILLDALNANHLLND